tara:strand:+ start:14249 stop:15157 length:909 start_codon:yes stop_codon:yes gene_type:complete
MAQDGPRLHAHWIAADGRAGHEGVADAIFPYWSFTKTAIAVGALKLVEAGALALDAPLAGDRFSLRQVLAHTAGLPDYFTLPEYVQAVARGDAAWPRDVLLERALAQGRLFAPGEGWAYSNVGYLLVRAQIEAATGMSLGDALTELLFAPLGLGSITLAETPAQFAPVHWTAAQRYDPGWVYHGCLTGTAADAARLLHALMGGAVLLPDTLAQMRAAHPLGGAIAGRPWTRCGYGLGLMAGTMAGAGAAEGHSGGGPFSVNAVYHFPDLPVPVTVACFAQGTDEGVTEYAAVEMAQGCQVDL